VAKLDEYFKEIKVTVVPYESIERRLEIEGNSKVNGIKRRIGVNTADCSA
jgi:hypothetical protein